MTIPVFAVEFPLFGSFASILGIFFGALVSGIIGAIALNFIDKAIAKKRKQENIEQQIEKSNEIITTQDQLIATIKKNVNNQAYEAADNIKKRHEKAADEMRSMVEEILNDETSTDISEVSSNQEGIDKLFDELKDL